MSTTPYPWTIIQTPQLIAIVYEGGAHIWRKIFMDGRGHDPKVEYTWLGDSIGHWEGDTLVVDSTGFNDKTRLDTIGHPHSDQLHVIQRFSRADPMHLSYEVTVEDPKAYTKPWTNKRVFNLKPKWELMEYSCEENNKEITDHLVK